MKIKMKVNEDGSVKYSDLNKNDESYLSKSVTQELTTDAFYNIFNIHKFDCDSINIKVAAAPRDGRAYFRVTDKYGHLHEQSSRGYGQGETWTCRAIDKWGTRHEIYARGTVAVDYTFDLEW